MVMQLFNETPDKLGQTKNKNKNKARIMDSFKVHDIIGDLASKLIKKKATKIVFARWLEKK